MILNLLPKIWESLRGISGKSSSLPAGEEKGFL
jgi:hypothetical protein